MEPHIDVITLAVDDLDRSLAFYRDGLGLETRGVVATEFVDEETNAAGAIVIFHLRGGLVLALYPRSELAKDADIPFGPPKTGELSIAHLWEIIWNPVGCVNPSGGSKRLGTESWRLESASSDRGEGRLLLGGVVAV